MAERVFDRDVFLAALATDVLGRSLVERASTGSTNDDAWDALAAGGADGLVVIAAEQVSGRGRAGRTWTHAPGQGLAMSVGLRLGAEAAHASLLPVAAGLAVAEALASLGADARLKWPNDVLVGGRKIAGVLCEMRRLGSGDAVVAGIGVDVRQRAEDFPPELRGLATSLVLAGIDASVEHVAARTLNALERLRARLAAGDRHAVLAGWSARAAFWGETVTVRAPGGDVTGVATRLDDSGALVLRLESGAERTVLAGDLLADGAPAAEAR